MRIPPDFVGREHILNEIEIKDNGERLVDLSSLEEFTIRIARKNYDGGPVLVRETVVEMLRKAENILPSHLMLVIRDAWRSEADQLNVIEDHILQYKINNPDCSDRAAHEYAERFAHPIREGEFPAPHTTGGAVDLTLGYSESNKLVPMRRSFRHCRNGEWDKQKSWDYRDLPKKILNNRDIFLEVTTFAGFVACPYEWWHVSYGDFYWAARTGKKETLYGPVSM